MQSICKQVEQIHSELSKMNLADKMGYIIGKQAEINSYANQLVQNRILRGSFTPEEKTAVQQLQEIQNELNVHKADVNREIHNEIGKELFKTIINLGRLVLSPDRYMEDLIIKDFETSVQNSAEAEELFGDTTDDIIAVANQYGFIEKIPILGWVVKTQEAFQDFRNLVFCKKIYRFLIFTSRYSKKQIVDFFEEYSSANQENGYESMLLVLERMDNYNKVDVMANLLKAKLAGKLSIDNFIRLTSSLQIVPYVDLRCMPDYLKSIGTRHDTYMLLAAGLLYQSAIGVDGVGRENSSHYQLNDNGLLFVQYGLGIDISSYVKSDAPIQSLTDEEIEDSWKKAMENASKSNVY